MLLGAPWLFALRILVTLKEKIIQSFHIPCVARDGGLIRAQGSPLWGKFLFRASACAKDETTR